MRAQYRDLASGHSGGTRRPVEPHSASCTPESYRPITRTGRRFWNSSWRKFEHSRRINWPGGYCSKSAFGVVAAGREWGAAPSGDTTRTGSPVGPGDHHRKGSRHAARRNAEPQTEPQRPDNFGKLRHGAPTAARKGSADCTPDRGPDASHGRTGPPVLRLDAAMGHSLSALGIA